MTNIAHNNSDLSDEEFKEEAHRHINKELIKDNIVIKQESIKDVYEREFGEVLEHYNLKQTILSTSSPQTYKKEAFMYWPQKVRQLIYPKDLVLYCTGLSPFSFTLIRLLL